MENKLSPRILTPEDFGGEVLAVARRLLGCHLIRRRADGRRFRGRIVEVEAYGGPEDRASHARRGLTDRCRSMFGPPGHAYVYFIYGMHHCLNVVTGPAGQASAVLIRALEPLEGLDRARCDGPGRLCHQLGIDRSLDGLALGVDADLWLECPGQSPARISASPRIGVDHAGPPWKDLPWRFYIPGSPAVSGRNRAVRAGP